MIGIISLVLVSVLPPEHIHRHTASEHHDVTVVHRHFAPHPDATSPRIGLQTDDDGAPQFLDDDVYNVAPHASVAAPALVVLPRHTFPAPAALPQPLAVEGVASIHDPPHLPPSFRAPPFQS